MHTANTADVVFTEDGSAASIERAAYHLATATDGVTFYREARVATSTSPRRRRYVVGDGRNGAQYREVGFRPLGQGDIDVVRQSVAHWLADGYDTVGAWLDEGTLYIDPGTLHADLDDALAVARSRGELAIWDRVDGREVRVTEG